MARERYRKRDAELEKKKQEKEVELDRTATNPLTTSLKGHLHWKDGDNEVTKAIGLDCEMVGVGLRGRDSALARVCIVNSRGSVLYDEYVKPQERVVDYRTQFSGITEEHLLNAKPFKTVQTEVAKMIKDKVIVGHDLRHDFKSLMFNHPSKLLRDTARYKPLLTKNKKPHKLKYLLKKLLDIEIQGDEHDPAEDARAAMLVYQFLRKDWEIQIKTSKFRKMKASEGKEGEKEKSEPKTE